VCHASLFLVVFCFRLHLLLYIRVGHTVEVDERLLENAQTQSSPTAAEDGGRAPADGRDRGLLKRLALRALGAWQVGTSKTHVKKMCVGEANATRATSRQQPRKKHATRPAQAAISTFDPGSNMVCFVHTRKSSYQCFFFYNIDAKTSSCGVQHNANVVNFVHCVVKGGIASAKMFL